MIPKSGEKILGDICQLRGWGVRPPQMSMVQQMDSSLRRMDQSWVDTLVSAPVGTGKTLGYLCAALPYGRMAVSTSTKALQEQIIGEELPEFVRNVQRLYKVDVSYYLLKGKDNYLCIELARKWLASHNAGLFGGKVSNEDIDRVRKLVADCEMMLEEPNRKSHDQESGLAELPDNIRMKITWGNPDAKKASGFDKDKSQSNINRDSYLLAKWLAGQATILVVNTSLVASDVWNNVNPATSVFHDRTIVFDEAHHAHSIILAAGSPETPTRAVMSTGVKNAKKMVDAFNRAVEEFDSMPNNKRTRRPIADATQGLMSAVLAEQAEQTPAMKNAVQACKDFLEAISSMTMVTSRDGLKRKVPTHDVSTEKVGQRTVIHVSKIFTDDFRLTLHSVASPENGSTSRVIFCSGTITYDDVRGIGVRRDVQHIEVGTPFDFGRCKMLIPQGWETDPTQKGWEQRTIRMVVDMVRAAGGRALILTTSLKRIRDYEAALRPLGHRIYTQDDDTMSRKEKIEGFTNFESSILIGTKSFWEGFDVPGDSLQLVVLDKIMFPIVTDHVTNAMCKAAKIRGDNEFMTVTVNHAKQMMAQGCGRLMRSVKDKGGIAVLDSRIRSKRYGRNIMSLVEQDMMVTDHLGHFTSWLETVTQWDGEGPTPRPQGCNWVPLRAIGN